MPEAEVVEHVRIGALDGANALTTVADLDRSDVTGRIYVSQPQEYEVKVFDRSGSLVGRIGRAGGGPGGFLAPSLLEEQLDTLWVLDSSNGRLTYFTGSGELLGVRTLPSLTLGATTYRGVGGPPLRGGGFLGMLVQIGTQGAGQPVPIIKRGEDGEVLDTLAWWRLPAKGSLELTVGETGTLYVALPLQDASLVALAPDGGGVAVLDELADRGVLRLVRVSAMGDTVLQAELPFEPVPLTDVFVDSVVSTLAKDVPGLASRKREIEEGIRRFGHFPSATRLHIGEDGEYWIRREDAGGATVEWTVLDSLGTPRLRASFPRVFRVLWSRADTAWGTIEGEYGEPYLVAYRVSPGR